MDKSVALEMIQETLDGLQRSRMLDDVVIVREDTVLLGSGSPLDSLAFVTMISELEDRLADATSREIFLSFDQISEGQPDLDHLSAATLADYIARVSREPA